MIKPYKWKEWPHTVTKGMNTLSSESEIVIARERNGKRHASVIKQLYCDKIAARVTSHV